VEKFFPTFPFSPGLSTLFSRRRGYSRISFRPNNFPYFAPLAALSASKRSPTQSPFEFMRIFPFLASYPDLSSIGAVESFFGTVKASYVEYRDSQKFLDDKRRAVYPDQIRTPRRAYTGLIACLDLEECLAGRVKAHERTLADSERKQIELSRRWRADIKPVLLAYPEAPAISRWLEAATTRATPFLSLNFDNGEQEHRLWLTSEADDIAEIQALFRREIPRAYIADGHHRTSAAAARRGHVRLEEEHATPSRLYCAFFAHTQLVIQSLDRVVEGLNGLSPSRLLLSLERLFDLERLLMPQRPQRKHEILLSLDGQWFRLLWKESVLQAFAAEAPLLDCALLQSLVFRDILGIEDPRVDRRLHYVEGVKGLESLSEQVEKKAPAAGFSLFPIAWDDLKSLADQGGVLPPKSTWFEPRMKNGLLVHPYPS
jgi:uncharacterized protein (DUF1015 family)